MIKTSLADARLPWVKGNCDETYVQRFTEFTDKYNEIRIKDSPTPEEVNFYNFCTSYMETAHRMERESLSEMVDRCVNELMELIK